MEARELAALVQILISTLTMVLFAYVLTSWFLEPYHPVRQTLGQWLEPILQPIRNLIPPVGGLDLSVMVLMIAVQVIGQALVAAILGGR